MTVPAETCAACRFDGAEYDVQDTVGTLRAVAPMWQQMLEGHDDDVLTARPATGSGWSVAEHAAHSASVAATVRRVFEQLLAEDDALIEVPEAPDRDPSDGTAAALDRLGVATAELARLAARAGSDDDPQWRRSAVVGGTRLDAAWVLRHAVHDSTHHHSEAGRVLHQLGAGASTQRGTVAQLNVSDGGVPKLPVDSVDVGFRGLAGDRQTARVHHGRPLQALCLWSADVIDALRVEGHPIGPGSAGENVTISGVDWATIRPGVRLQIGDALAEVSAYATPCKKNAQWFDDGRFNRMLHDQHPGWSRVYAWVREPGRVTTGDLVVVEP